MADETNPAAALAKKRWDKTSKAAKKANSVRLAEARQAATTPEKRSEIAKKAALARWAKKKSPKRKPKAD